MTNSTSVTAVSHDTSANDNTFPAPPDSVPHNLFNSTNYLLLPLYMRLFIALFARIDYNDLNKELFVPIGELIPGQRAAIVRGDSTAQALAEMRKGMRRMQLHVEAFENEHRQRLDKSVVTSIDLMRLVEYDGQQGGVRAKFGLG